MCVATGALLAIEGGAVRDSGSLDAQGHRKNQPNVPDLTDNVAKKLGEKPETAARGIGYFDPENRIVLKELQNVLETCSTGMIPRG